MTCSLLRRNAQYLTRKLVLNDVRLCTARQCGGQQKSAVLSSLVSSKPCRNRPILSTRSVHDAKQNIGADVKFANSGSIKPNNKRHESSSSTAWNIRYQELIDYIKEHGNSFVPWNYEANPSLYYWTNKQRYYYKANNLAPERIEKLNSIGFTYDINQAQWQERYQELCKYRRDNGDTLVPRNYPAYPFLGKWVNNQRQDYKRFMSRKSLEDTDNDSEINQTEMGKVRSTGMTEERVQLLESQDFIWDPLDYHWQQKYKELREWIARNGHGAIYLTKKHDPLETWAVRQRNMYKRYIDGAKIGLPSKTVEERILKLKELGFVFDLKKPRMKSTCAIDETKN